MTGAASLTLANPNERRVNVVQGEQFVSDDPNLVLTTLLGSCVAACIRDPVAGVGGINHFLLPGDRTPASDSVRYGVHAMELLLNALLRHGARRERLEAKLFGGANLMRGLTDVGAMNAAFATDFLKREDIRHVGGSLGGEAGRRIQYWPVSGRARQVFLSTDDRIAFEAERKTRAPAPSGALELF